MKDKHKIVSILFSMAMIALVAVLAILDHKTYQQHPEFSPIF